jgi:RNA polymerase sigma-70 factor (ECF subfamily)
MVSEWKQANAQKRGGGCLEIPFDVAEAEQRLALELGNRHDPEVLFERSWAVAVLNEAARLLRAEFQQAGRERLFEALHGFLEGDADRGACAAAAEALHTTEGTIRVAVHRLRQRYRELLRSVVARTVETPLEVEEELRHLRAVFNS